MFDPPRQIHAQAEVIASNHQPAEPKDHSLDRGGAHMGMAPRTVGCPCEAHAPPKQCPDLRNRNRAGAVTMVGAGNRCGWREVTDLASAFDRHR